MTYWLGVACGAHTLRGKREGFAQLGHGKHAAVKSLRQGDWIIYYAPRMQLEGGAPLQAFTTIGQITSPAPYQARQAAGFAPYRVDVAYVETAREVPIRPLLDRLELTRGLGNKWGMAVRGSKARLSEGDFRMIAEAMGVPQSALAPPA